MKAGMDLLCYAMILFLFAYTYFYFAMSKSYMPDCFVLFLCMQYRQTGK